jgi:beta-galactosidase/beta-glucuronidase
MNKAPFRPLATGLWFGLLCSLPAFSQETQRQYLSGHGKDDAVPWKFLCTSGPQSGYWTNLPVPSNWELHGFGTLSYHKDPTNAWDERGLYQLDFVGPTQDSGQRVFLVFDGVMTDTSAALNGGPRPPGRFLSVQI